MKQIKKTLFNRGFTLIELLVVISIIGIIGSVILTSMNTARGKARNAQRIANVNQIANAITLYQMDNGEVPPGEDGVEYVNGNTEWIPGLAPKYISSVPSDPVDTEPHKFHYSRHGNDYEVISFLEQNGNDASCGDGGSSCQYYEKASGEFLVLVNPGASGWRFASSTEIVITPPPPTPTTSVSAPVSVTIGWYKGFSGQPPVGTYQMAISFSYASNVSDVQSFRLYLKKPGESSFSAVATFAGPASINSTCSGYINSGTWRMRNCTTSGGGYWQIFSSNEQSSSYLVGEYDAYLVALNNSGVEGPVSSTAKNIVSKTAILSPIGVQNSLTPQFRWTVPNSWPGGLFNLQVYDGTNYVWNYGGFSMAAGTVEGSYTYNGPPLTSPYFGPALSPSKTYYVNIWAEGSDSNGTRNFSMGDSNPSFTVSSAPTP